MSCIGSKHRTFLPSPKKSKLTPWAASVSWNPWPVTSMMIGLPTLHRYIHPWSVGLHCQTPVPLQVSPAHCWLVGLPMHCVAHDVPFWQTWEPAGQLVHVPPMQVLPWSHELS